MQNRREAADTLGRGSRQHTNSQTDMLNRREAADKLKVGASHAGDAKILQHDEENHVRFERRGAADNIKHENAISLYQQAAAIDVRVPKAGAY